MSENKPKSTPPAKPTPTPKPITPAKPPTPVQPIAPGKLTPPAKPTTPAQSTTPAKPTTQAQPTTPAKPTAPAPSTKPTPAKPAVRQRAESKTTVRPIATPTHARGGNSTPRKPAAKPTAKPAGKTSPANTKKNSPAASSRSWWSNIREIKAPQWKLPTFAKPAVALQRPAIKINFNFDPRRQAIFGGLLLILSTIILFLSYLSTNQGWVTGTVLDFVALLVGWSQPLVLLLLMSAGFSLIAWGMERPITIPPLRIVGGIMLFLVGQGFASMLALVLDNGLNSFEAIQATRVGGGLIGNVVANSLTQLAGRFGAIFVLVVLGLIAAAVVTGLSKSDFGYLFNLLLRRSSTPPANPVPAGTNNQPTLPFDKPRRPAPPPAPRSASTPAAESKPAGSDDVRQWVEPPRPADPDGKNGRPKAAAPSRFRAIKDKLLGQEQTEPAPPQPLILGRETKANRKWQIPALDEMLNLGTEHHASTEHIDEQTAVIQHTLESFGAPGSIVGVQFGPTIIQYCVEPQYIMLRNGKRTKVKVGKIASLADDLALALSARSVRIQAPVPGKGYVGIEVPNEHKTVVSLRDVMESEPFEKLHKKSTLSIGLGQDVSGQSVAADLTRMPHLLIAGATGSGKSVCVNAIIACLLMQNSPEDLQMVMVDPKRVELTGYNGIPHLAAPVVVDMDRVVGTLQWALREMDGRYRMFAELGARNITDYNRIIQRDHQKQKLPYIVIIVDELADLMMMAPEDTERSIARLAQMARATGIHMILATQRPSVDVVTGLIKANFPARIAFAVASSTDSRVVLDTTGAERLLGQGDMLFQDPNAPAPVRMQGCFVSDAELNKIIDYWKTARRFAGQLENTNIFTPTTEAVKKSELSQEVWDVDPDPAKRIKMAPRPAVATPTPAVVPPKSNGNGVAAVAPPRPAQVPLLSSLQKEIQAEQEKALQANSDEDDLWEEAVNLVKKAGKGSASYLQRYLRIGYTRASRLIDRMEEEGIIGPPTGTSKARPLVGAEDDEDDDEDFEDEE